MAPFERGTYLSLDADEAPDPVRFLEAVNGVREAAAKAGKAHPRVAFCGNVQDACGPKAERRRRFSSNNSVANSRMTSTFCARIRCRTRKTMRRSSASARSTPLFLPVTAGTWGDAGESKGADDRQHVWQLRRPEPDDLLVA